MRVRVLTGTFDDGFFSKHQQLLNNTTEPQEAKEESIPNVEKAIPDRQGSAWWILKQEMLWEENERLQRLEESRWTGECVCR